MAKQTRREQREASRNKLLHVARERFGQDGYTAVSMADIAQTSGLAIGGLYHHFPDKQALFAAVVGELRIEVAAHVAEEARRRRLPWNALESGCLAFLDFCSRPPAARILSECEAVLGEDPVHLAEAAKPIEAGLRAALAGQRSPVDLSTLAAIIYGAILGARGAIVRADDVEKARLEATRAMRRLLAGLKKELNSNT